jgi:hypothetical protein
VIFVVLLVISSDGGSCGDVGRNFFVMTSNVGMTTKLIPQVLLSEPMLASGTRLASKPTANFAKSMAHGFPSSGFPFLFLLFPIH